MKLYDARHPSGVDFGPYAAWPGSWAARSANASVGRPVGQMRSSFKESRGGFSRRERYDREHRQREAPTTTRRRYEA